MRKFFVSLLFAILAMLVAESVTSEDARAQFPILAVDTVVRNRLASEWQQDNSFQHERGYCVIYLTIAKTMPDGTPIVLFWVTDIMRADEEKGSGTGVSMDCPRAIPNQTMLHIHPPAICPQGDEGSHCVLHHPLGQQCFPSPTDMRELNKSNQPFWIIQCDKYALVPVWRTAPYPLDELTRPELHR